MGTRKAVAFLASLIPVLVFGAFAMSIMQGQAVRNPRAMQETASLVVAQVFEGPGNWNSTEMRVGLALVDEGVNYSIIWPYVVDPVKLERAANMTYGQFKSALPTGGLDVRVSFYRFNESSGEFSRRASLILGSKVTRGFAVGQKVYVYLAGDATVNGNTMGEGLYRAEVTLFGG